MNPKLKYRHELKYYMNDRQYQVVSRQLKGLLQPDRNGGSTGEYHIRSLYFDDIDNKALHEKLAGVCDREKYRIRIYDRSDKVILLEKKIKFRDYITKLKEPLTKEMYAAIMAGDYEVLNRPAKPLLAEMYFQMKNKLLRPKVIVDYVREAYIARTGNVRVTFDKQLKTGLNQVDIFDPNLCMINAFDENLTVFEVKYDEYIPDFVRMAVQVNGLVRQSNSKYVLCRKHTKFNSWEDQ